MSARDRERFRRQAEDLDRVKTDERGTPQIRRQLLDLINRHRRRLGVPVFEDEHRPPEEGFYERARALGLPRARR